MEYSIISKLVLDTLRYSAFGVGHMILFRQKSLKFRLEKHFLKLIIKMEEL